ncbi:hypothetical protein [Nocardiopsis kunsanensis]|uniref:hypothetical protein n=1 Tax=Nocardiopsis kunsanensis TaxID=141693 RepID=UPI000344C0DE|nr:hypothetical protein [Nocardiopsis kunsanensis]
MTEHSEAARGPVRPGPVLSSTGEPPAERATDAIGAPPAPLPGRSVPAAEKTDAAATSAEENGRGRGALLAALAARRAGTGTGPSGDAATAHQRPGRPFMAVAAIAGLVLVAAPFGLSLAQEQSAGTASLDTDPASAALPDQAAGTATGSDSGSGLEGYVPEVLPESPGAPDGAPEGTTDGDASGGGPPERPVEPQDGSGGPDSGDGDPLPGTAGADDQDGQEEDGDVDQEASAEEASQEQTPLIDLLTGRGGDTDEEEEDGSEGDRDGESSEGDRDGESSEGEEEKPGSDRGGEEDEEEPEGAAAGTMSAAEDDSGDGGGEDRAGTGEDRGSGAEPAPEEPQAQELQDQEPQAQEAPEPFRAVAGPGCEQEGARYGIQGDGVWRSGPAGYSGAGCDDGYDVMAVSGDPDSGDTAAEWTFLPGRAGATCTVKVLVQPGAEPLWAHGVHAHFQVFDGETTDGAPRAGFELTPPDEGRYWGLAELENMGESFTLRMANAGAFPEGEEAPQLPASVVETECR